LELNRGLTPWPVVAALNARVNSPHHRHFVSCLAIALIAIALARGADEPATHPLVWDAMEKTSEPKLGDAAANFAFHVTNNSAQPVTILQVRPSCGCTVVQLPPTPWVLAAGASGDVGATIDLRGKEGVLEKALFVASNQGPQTLVLRVKVPQMDAESRKRNQELAAANRQAVFQNDCAVCHATPAVGKMDGELFGVACAICHISSHRATMVPDLLVAHEHRDEAWWTKWITDGKEGSLMPGFARKNGGTLTDAQIQSLARFLVANLPTEPEAN
jgi:mono/diheme cytochrome c family protein